MTFLDEHGWSVAVVVITFAIIGAWLLAGAP